jgi:magnesium transporter
VRQQHASFAANILEGQLSWHRYPDRIEEDTLRVKRTDGQRKKAVGKGLAARLVRASRNLSEKRGMAPGTLVHVGDLPAQAVRVSIVTYDKTECTEHEGAGIQDLLNLHAEPKYLWVNVEGVYDVEIVQALGTRFHLHPLVLEDVANASQRPKLEDCGDYVFVVLKILHFLEDTMEVSSEQMSLVLGSNYLITFREFHGDEFDEVKQRLVSGKGRLRSSGIDFLAYILLDTVVDHYFVILEKLAERIEFLEEDLVSNLSPDTLHAIHSLKTDMIFLRRSIWPLREIVNRLMDGNIALIGEPTLPYLRDLYDNAIHAVDLLETYRDVVSGMLDIYLSGMSNKLNEIMKVLTVIATIFIPLTFMTGWYGMNFKYMPELQWPWGYPAFALLALAAAATMLIFFWRRKWL